MTDELVRVELFFDVDAYFQTGRVPWTFFAFPTSLASSDGLPPDRTACRILAKIQAQLPVAVWRHESNPETTYFVCRFEDRATLDEALRELHELGLMEQGYFARRCEELFGEANRATERNDKRKDR